jgi:hypothetical protein
MNGVIKFLSLFLIIHSFLSCKPQNQAPITLNFQKDLITEGITIDTKTQTIFLNSLRHGKIVSCNLDGSNPQNFITDNKTTLLTP